MEDFSTGRGTLSVWAIVAIIGGFLAIISLWLATTKIGGLDAPITGWDFLTSKFNGEHVDDAYTFWRFMPFIAAIAGVGVVVFTALPAFGVGSPSMKVVGMIFGIVLLVISLLIIFCTAGKLGFEGNTDGFKFHRQIGAYLTLYGGIMAAGAGFYDWFSSKPKTEKVKVPKEEAVADDEPAEAEETAEAPAEEAPAAAEEAAEPAEEPEPEAAEEESEPAEEERKTAA